MQLQGPKTSKNHDPQRLACGCHPETACEVPSSWWQRSGGHHKEHLEVDHPLIHHAWTWSRNFHQYGDAYRWSLPTEFNLTLSTYVWLEWEAQYADPNFACKVNELIYLTSNRLFTYPLSNPVKISNYLNHYYLSLLSIYSIELSTYHYLSISPSTTGEPQGTAVAAAFWERPKLWSPNSVGSVLRGSAQPGTTAPVTAPAPPGVTATTMRWKVLTGWLES